MVRVAVLVRHHAHDVRAAQLGAERAADAAIRAGGDDAALGAPWAISDFSVSAIVGQACTQAPQETHSESKNASSCPATMLDSKPRPWIVSASVPCCSSQARTQREQTMHFDASKLKYGFDSSFARNSGLSVPSARCSRT